MRLLMLTAAAVAFATSAHAGFFQSVRTDENGVTNRVTIVTPEPPAPPVKQPVWSTVETRKKDNGKVVTITRYSDGTSTRSTKGGHHGKH